MSRWSSPNTGMRLTSILRTHNFKFLVNLVSRIIILDFTYEFSIFFNEKIKINGNNNLDLRNMDELCHRKDEWLSHTFTR